MHDDHIFWCRHLVHTTEHPAGSSILAAEVTLNPEQGFTFKIVLTQGMYLNLKTQIYDKSSFSLMEVQI